MAARTVEIAFLGSTAQLESALKRAGLVAEESGAKIQGSADAAGRAAAEQAARMGKAADEQVAAAGRAAAAFTDAQVRMSRAQKAAGDAAASTARRMGLSADEQKAAATRAIASQGELEAATKRSAAVAEESGARIGSTFEAGTSRAGSAIHKFAGSAAAIGVPFTGALDKVGTKFDEATSHSQRFGAAMAGLGKLTVGAGIAGFAAAAYEGVKGAAELQKQMEMIHTQAGATQGEVKRMTQAVLGMAGSVATGPEELAKGLYHVESQGLHGAKALDVLKVAAEGAKIGNANLEDVTNALGAVIASGVKGVQNYGQAMGALNATVGAGDMRMQDLADALGTHLIGAMQTYGVSLRDAGAALAVFGDNNIRGADAGTKLASAIRIMAAPSNAASKALAAIGISSKQLGDDIRSGGLIKALEDLKTHLKASGATATEQGLIVTRAFGGKQAGGVQLLLGELPRLKQKFEDVGRGANRFGSDWAANQKTLATQIDQLKATVQSLADKFGMYLIPKLQAAGSAIGSVISWMQKHQAAAQSLARVIEGVLGVAVAAYAYQKAAAFVTATRTMITGMGSLAGSAASTAQTVGQKLGLVSASSEATAGKVAASDAEIEASNTTAAASFAEVGTGAEGAAAKIAATGGEMVASVEATDAAVEASNAAAGASFTAMLGPIGAVVGALVAAQPLISKWTGGDLSAAPGEATQPGQAYKGPGAPPWGTFSGPQADYQGIPMNETPGKTVYDFLTKVGHLSPAAAAGFVGNFQQESSLNYKQNNAQLGLANWMGSRRAGLNAAAKKEGLAPTTLRAQLNWVLTELHGSYKGLLQQLQNPHLTAAQAADLISSEYEKAGSLSRNDNREKYARQAYSQYTSSGGNGNVSAAEKHLHNAEKQGYNTGVSPALQKYLDSTTGATKHKKKVAAALAVPAGVATMLSTAEALVGTRYSYGGGHGGWDPVAALKQIGVDCTGFVSQVLHKGGILSTPQDTVSLPRAGGISAGQGRFVTVWDRPQPGQQGHALIDILGHWFESGGNSKFNPKGGVAALTAHQAAGEIALGGFHPYHPKALNRPVKAGSRGASNIRVSRGGALGAGASVESIINAAIAARQAAIQKQQQQLGNQASSLLTRTSNAVQNGTVKAIESLLGVTLSGHRQTSIAHTLTGLAATGAPLTAKEANKRLVPTLAAASKTSPQQQAFDKLIAALVATHNKHLAQLAGQLVTAHKNALTALGQQLYAAQLTKDSQTAQLQATQIKDQAQLDSNTAAAQLQIDKDTGQQQVDAIQAAARNIDDVTSQIRDSFQSMAQSIEDQTKVMSDSSAGVVQGIQDQTQVRVDVLGERGLYGLNLIAQQQQVQLDTMKASYDQQISQAQVNLDQVQATWDGVVAARQQAVDLAQLQGDQKIAKAQAHDDAVKITADQQIMAAQQHVDSVTLSQDIAVQLAQTAVALSASASKAQQSVAQALLNRENALHDELINKAESDAQAAQTQANNMIQDADGKLNEATATATQAESDANQALATAQGQASLAIAQANQALQQIQGTAAQAEAQAQAAVDITRAEAQSQYAGSGLTINIEGIHPTDAAAIATEVGWALRTRIPA